MSYCVNCGVELDSSVKSCPLCHTPVINPNSLVSPEPELSYPPYKGQVEQVSHRDFLILISVVLGTTALTCFVLNLFLIPGASWSFPVIGTCFFLWVVFIPTTVFPNISKYIYFFLDGIALALALYLITFLTPNTSWFYQIAIPLVLTVIFTAELITFLVQKLPFFMLVGLLYFFLFTALLSVNTEVILDLFFYQTVSLSWSAVVLTVCAIISITLITILSISRLRNVIRKRLHL